MTPRQDYQSNMQEIRLLFGKIYCHDLQINRILQNNCSICIPKTSRKASPITANYMIFLKTIFRRKLRSFMHAGSVKRT